jgi:adenylate cyclase
MRAERLRDLKLCGLALLVMSMFAWAHLGALDIPWLRRLELAALDLQIRLRGRQPPGPETVIVMIDEQTIEELGRWPVPRGKMAELVNTLHRAGAKAIGIDILFAEHESTTVADANARGEYADDAALARAIADAGNVALPFTFKFGGLLESAADPYLTRAGYARIHKSRDVRPITLKPTGVLLPIPMLAEVAALGHTLVAFDIDGAPRYDYPALEYDLDYFPSMAVRIVQLFLEVPWNEVTVELGQGIALGPVHVPTDPQMRLLVNYPGPSRTFPTYSLAKVLSGTVPDAVFRDRVVLVGANAIGARDSFQSPFTAVMPGVERLAAVVDSILHERQIRRTESAPWVEGASMLAASLVLGFTVSRLSLAAASLYGIALVAAFAAWAQIALSRYGLWFASAVPIVAIILSFIALSLYRYGLLDRERRHIRHAFQRYLAPQMVDRLLSNQKLPELGGERRELTILFCDLRGFTSLSERLDPAVLTRMVNEFFAMATEAIQEQGGTIDKYIGDAIMAFWNAPTDQPDHASLACRAALRMLKRIEEFNASAASNGDLPPLHVGIGINTGPCTVGNFGSSRRFDYSAIGDAVNVAARLEGETKAYGISILLGPETAAQVTHFAILPIDRIRPRGRAEALEIFALVGDETVMATPSFRALSSKHRQLSSELLEGDRERIQRILNELKTLAPASLKPLYDAFDLHHMQRGG